MNLLGLTGIPTWLLSPKLWGAIGVGLVLAFCGIQTARLNHAKSDLTAARAALIDPATKKHWQAEALQSASDLATCHENAAKLTAALDQQNAAIAAMSAAEDRREAAYKVTLAQSAATNADLLARAKRALVAPSVEACGDDIIMGGFTQ